MPPSKPLPQPTPYKTGDPALDKGDLTASTNYIPGVSQKDSVGMSRGITRREDRDEWLGPKEYRRQTDNEIAQGQTRYRDTMKQATAPRRATKGRSPAGRR